MKYTHFFATCVLASMPAMTLAAYGDTTTFVSQPFYTSEQHRLEAIFDFPQDAAFSPSGYLYIADTYNNAIRKISPSGVVTTVAGTGGYGLKNGAKLSAQFALPKGIDVTSKAVFVADTDNDAIRKVKGSKVKTLISGLNAPEDVAVYGSYMYFLDTGNNALKRASKKGENVVTITDDLSHPSKLDFSSDGQYAYIANTGTHQLVRVNLTQSNPTPVVIAGTGSEGDSVGACSESDFNDISGVHVYDDDTIFVTDGNGYEDSVKKITLSGCTVEYFAQDDGMLFVNFPRGLDSLNEKLYVVSAGISIIEEFDVNNGNHHNLYAGAGRFNTHESDPLLVGNPKSLALSPDKQTIYISENNQIRKMAKKNPTVNELVVGSEVDNYAKNDNAPKFGSAGRFSDPTSITISPDGAHMYVVDRNNHRIRLVDIEAGSVEYLTGAGEVNYPLGGNNGYADGDACPNTFETGVDGCAYFYRPYGSVLSPDGQYLYVTDAGNNRIRRVTVTGENKGRVITIAGSGDAGFENGTGTEASFNTPLGITITTDGDTLYVADRDNHAIRAIDVATHVVTTVVGTGTAGYLDAELDRAVLSYPESLALRKNGKLFFAEAGSQRVRVVNFAQGVTKLVAGTGDRGYQDGTRTEAQFNNPKGMLKLKKKLLIAELYNDTIRAISTKGTEPYTDPAPVVSSVVAGACSGTQCTVSKSWSADGTLSIQVEGTGFRYGAKGYVGAYESTVYVSSSTSVVVRMPISSMPAGTYSIRIQNSDGQYTDLANSLVITN